MSQLQVDGITNANGDGAPNFPKGLTGTTANFTGNVSIAGTLTHEDVKNVDSVGLITARTGLRVTDGGIVVTAGVSTFTTVSASAYAGDGAGLSGITGFTGTATTLGGTIEANKPAIMNDDGKVGVVTGLNNITGPVVQYMGESAYFETNAMTGAGSIGAEKKLVGAYKNGQNNWLWARVGTVSADGRTTTWGNEVQVSAASFTDWVQLVHIPGSNKVAFLYADANSSNEGSCRIGTVSGTTISLGAKSVFESGNTQNGGACWDPTHQRILMAYRDGGDSGYAKVSVGEVGVSTAAWNGPYQYNYGNEIVTYANFNKIAYDTKRNQVFLFFRYNDPGYYETGTISLDGAVWKVNFNNTTTGGDRKLAFDTSAQLGDINVVYDTKADRIIMATRYQGTSDAVSTGYLRSGQSVAVGSTFPYAFGPHVKLDTEGKAVSLVRMVYSSVGERPILMYQSAQNANISYTAVVNPGINSSLAITSAIEVTSIDSQHYPFFGYSEAANKVLIVNRNASNRGDVILQQPRISNVTPGNMFGFFADDYADGAEASVKLVGQQIFGQAGLVPGKRYFVQANGELSDTDDGEGIIAGMGISATGLLIKG